MPDLRKTPKPAQFRVIDTADAPVSTMAALMLAVFTVSVGFGVVLPLLPYLIERLLGAGVEAAQVPLHTGLLTAAFTFSPFLFSPFCGSDPLLRVFIDYALPPPWPDRWLGRVFGSYYARWCTQSMVDDAVRRFNPGLKPSAAGIK